jgi:hypothetical protein
MVGPLFHSAPLTRKLGKGSSKNLIAKLQNSMAYVHYLFVYRYGNPLCSCVIFSGLRSQMVVMLMLIIS